MKLETNQYFCYLAGRAPIKYLEKTMKKKLELPPLLFLQFRNLSF